ncbi:hypothetical protein LF1_00130 [Rubripirellula obstinata]|uniref:Uncharacterized protein n=1 Tax=Rubripirellula obstinata TaxID=406547 RepID=A0A5B1CAG0_9BACT|nr:hypothetical protein LF1_00130 [Rubripirellula obstinata]
MDVSSLELAIYFVLPPLLLGIASYATADFFVIVAGLTVKREVKRDTGVTAMTILIIATSTVAFLTYWTTKQPATTIVSATVAYFVAGGLSYAWLVHDYCDRGTKHRFTPIGIKRGFSLSALLSLFTAGPASLVAWFVIGG